MTSSVVLTHTEVLRPDSTPINNTPVVNENNEKQFYASAIQRLLWKLDRRILPFIALLEISSFMNRVSIGHARLMGIETDLSMTEVQFGLVISIFYIARFLFDTPSNLLLRFIGLTRYLALNTIVWGSITVGMAFVTNVRQLIIVRFFLGVIQAGYFPCIIIYFSLWYCKRNQTMRMAILYSAGIISRALAGVLAYGMDKMDGIGGLNSWQWSFLVEGLPIIPLGIITYLFLDSVPNTVQWLSNIEKQLLTNLLRNDAGIADRNLASSNRLSWRQVRNVFVDWRVYFYGMIAIGNEAVILSLTTYFPILLASIGYSKNEAYLFTAPPYVVTCVFCLLVNYSSSRQNEHGYHIAFCLLIGFIGFILMLTLFNQGKVAVFASASVTFCGILSSFPLLLSWITINVGGYTKRAMAISFVIGIGQIGGIFTPLIYKDDDKPIYRRGHAICGGITLVTLILTIIFRICLLRENNRRKNLSLEEYRREATIDEPCDCHPDVRYML